MPALTDGLSTKDVPARRAEYGSNVLTPPPRTPGWKLYLAKFDDPVIRILMIAAGIAIAVGTLDGQVAESVGILIAILLATFLAYWNESRAARAFEILNTTSDDVPVKVIRDGGYTNIPKRDVVVGDLVFIEIGEEVPADGTLREVVGLLMNESRLTGESVPVEHLAGDKLFRGTTVVDGNGLVQIDAVGDRTELGRTLTESIIATGAETPLNRQLARLSQMIGVAGFGIALAVFLALLGRGLIQGTIELAPSENIFLAILTLGVAVALINVWLPICYDALDLAGVAATEPSWLGGRSWIITIVLGLVLMGVLAGIAVAVGLLPPAPADWLALTDARQLLRNFMIAVTIIVVAVPEGLAMSVTLSLAYSMRKMTASNTLVRRMAACETIGATTVICSDKTGTLTMNEMRLVEFLIDGNRVTAKPESRELEQQLSDLIITNTTAQLSYDNDTVAPLGNPTDAALLMWLHDQGIDYRRSKSRDEILIQWSFNSERKFMATCSPAAEGNRKLHVKGAPEIVLERCTRIATRAGIKPITDSERTDIAARLKEYQSRGMRTLGLAFRIDLPDSNDLDRLSCELVWLGVAALADPVRPEAPAAIAACRHAGVRVKIVTGDSVETAREIARQIGLDDTATPLTGMQFAAMNDREAREAAGQLTVLARARPADKLRLVKSLKERGEVVAVTGDGVNDGPALNHADVGLAMGKTGTAVAREASDIVLLDDSFPSIVSAIRWGRTLYENIQRFILFQLTINVVALALAVLGPFLGFELPLTVMQMLWVNLIMDTFAALALATEPPHEGVLSRPPRSPQAFIITPVMAKSIFGASTVFLIVLVAFIISARQSGALANSDEPTRAGTILFTIFVLLQFWNLFNAKAFGRGGSVIPTLASNPSFLLIAAGIFAGQVLLVQFGGQVFRTVPLSLSDWLTIVGGTSLVLVLGEIQRLMFGPRAN